MLEATNEPLSKLKRMPRNPKLHDIGGLHESYERFGFLDRIVINDATGHLLAGHGRIDALQQRKAQGLPRPENVEERDGEWFVPADHANVPEELEEAACVALNRWTERGGWDESLLAAVLSDLATEEDGLDGVGYDEDDLDALLAFSSFDDFEDLPDLDWDDPAKAWRIIIQCEDEDQYWNIREYLGFTEDGDDVVRFNYADIDWKA